MTNLFLQSGSGQSGLPMLIMMVAIFAIMWLFMIRPQQKKQKKIREFQNALKEGDKVVTGGGDAAPRNMVAATIMIEAIAIAMISSINVIPL